MIDSYLHKNASIILMVFVIVVCIANYFIVRYAVQSEFSKFRSRRKKTPVVVNEVNNNLVENNIAHQETPHSDEQSYIDPLEEKFGNFSQHVNNSNNIQHSNNVQQSGNIGRDNYLMRDIIDGARF